jgi:hypothetical protein
VEDCVLRVWDVETGRVLREMQGHGSPVRTIDVSADGEMAVSVDHRGEARVWRLRDGATVGRINGLPPEDDESSDRRPPRIAAAFLADGGAIVTAGMEGVKLWQLSDFRDETSRATPELDELVRITEEHAARVRQAFEAGEAPLGQCIDAAAEAHEARFRRAQGRGDANEALEMLEEIVSLREQAVTQLRAVVAAGELPQSALSEAEKNLVEAKLRLSEFKNR